MTRRKYSALERAALEWVKSRLRVDHAVLEGLPIEQVAEAQAVVDRANLSLLQVGTRALASKTSRSRHPAKASRSTAQKSRGTSQKALRTKAPSPDWSNKKAGAKS